MKPNPRDWIESLVAVLVAIFVFVVWLWVQR